MTDTGETIAPDAEAAPLAAVPPGQAAYEARQRSHWERRNHRHGDRPPIPWADLTDGQRADEEAAAMAAIGAGPLPRLADLLAARRERDQALAELRELTGKAALRDMTRGQAARKAWQDWCAGSVQRGRGRPGYDEKAETDAGWEVAADAGIEASGLRAQLDEARRELAEVRELAHNLGDVRKIDALTAEREKLSGACQLLARVVSDQGRALYAAWIDAERGDHDAAKETVTQQIEQVLELHTWNGTETGTQWLERTDGEENEDDGTAPVLADPETMTAVAEGERDA